MKLILNDCLLAMKEIPDNSVDSVVTDPPYGLSFMGKAWDYDVPKVEVWSEVLRVLKPGGHLLSFAGSRTYHRIAVNIEDAGFEIRDMIEWVYGSGFPKSLNIAKKLEGVTGKQSKGFNTAGGKENFEKQDKSFRSDYGYVWKPESELAKQWEGWGTALKPAHEPIVMARKPLIGTVVENVIKYGTGGINIDGCRVEGEGYSYPNGCGGSYGSGEIYGTASDEMRKEPYKSNDLGRFPANLIHDGSDEVLAVFPNCKPATSRTATKPSNPTSYSAGGQANTPIYQDATQSAARFFYCAKASKSERNMGCEELEEKIQNNTETNSRTFNDRCLTCKKKFVGSDNTICHCPPELKITDKTIYTNKNNHPCVKPIALMQYLVRLVTPPNGTVLDPFMGSGTTGIAAKREGFSFIGIEREPEYLEIAKARIDSA